MADPKGGTEQLVAMYLEQRGWKRGRDWHYEKTINGKEPDFLVKLSAGQFVMEVYEPHDEQLPGMTDPYQAIRKYFGNTHKMEQVAAVRGVCIPFVAVLGVTHISPPPDPFFVPGAMFGQIEVRLPVGPSKTDPEHGAASLAFGSDMTITEDCRDPYPALDEGISALVMLTPFNPTDHHVQKILDQELAFKDDTVQNFAPGAAVYRRCAKDGSYALDVIAVALRIWHNPGALHPLPIDVFNSSYDTQHGPILNGLRLIYGELSGDG